MANHASPCAPYNAGFSTGLGKDPNELTYLSPRSARLATQLNFNPTRKKEGALTRETYCYQRDVPGIQKTAWKHPRTKNGGVHIPTSSSYLRKYNQKTGFEVLRNGKPVVARSPVRAMGVEIIAHVDRTTHGVSQGIGGLDHYFVIFFPFNKPIGKKTV